MRAQGRATTAGVHPCDTDIAMAFGVETEWPDGMDVLAMAGVRKESTLIHTKDGTVEFKIPRNFDEAMRSPDKEKWLEACRKELDSHHEAGTWQLISFKDAIGDSKKKIVGSTWAFDLKRNADGTISRYKARLCAQGFSQIENVDYVTTYSNACHHTTLRVLFAVAAGMGLHLSGADVHCAYLYGFIEDNITIIMRPPRGFEQYDEDGHVMLCKLIRSIYGLRQSGARWEARLSQKAA